MIIIEREAVLCLVNREGPSTVPLPEILSELPKTSSISPSPSVSLSSEDDSIQQRESLCPKTGLATSTNSTTPSSTVFFGGSSSPISIPVESVLYSTDEESEDLEDDVSCSTFSVSSSSVSGDRRESRVVSWSEPLVTEVRTRPRTLPEDLHDLFYTYEETQRFRQEYRQEKKMLAQLQADPCTMPTSCSDPSTSTSSSPSFSSSNLGRHRISRVVVMHNDTLKTFFDDDLLSPKLPSSTKHNDDESGGIANKSPSLLPCGKSDDFFDDDSFWSGSITWY